MLTAPDRMPAPARSPFYALVRTVNTSLFSKNVSSVGVDVLSGTVGHGEPVEFVRADGSTVLAVAHGVEDAFGGGRLVRLAKPCPLRDELGTVDIVRIPGLQAPPLEVDPAAAGTPRLLESVRAARLQGFQIPEVSWRGSSFATASRDRAGLLSRLPDEAVALVVQKRIAEALASHDDPGRLASDCQVAADHLEAIGLQEDGDRMMLAAAAGLQGHQASPSTRALASVVAMGALAIEKAGDSATMGAKGLELGLGIEMGDGFAVGYQSGFEAQGDAIERGLLGAGRAVGLAWCVGCGAVVQLERGRCPRHGRRTTDPIIVVPSDVTSAVEALRSQYGPAGRPESHKSG